MLKPGKQNSVWVLSSQRTGSGYLCSLLGNATGLFWYEIFSGRNLSFADFRDSDGEIKMLPRRAKIQGFQFLDFFRSDKDKKSILKFLPEVKFILLQRKSLIDQTVSLYIAKKTNKFKNENKNITIYEKNEILCLYNENKNEREMWLNFLVDKKYFSIFYEDLFGNRMKELFDYVGIDLSLLDQAKSRVKNKKTSNPQRVLFKKMLENDIR